jgi:hypothetical protein
LQLEVEAQVNHGAIYPAGRVSMDGAQLAKLLQREGNDYGRYLGQRLASCLPLKAAVASLNANGMSRVQLMLEPPMSALNSIRWERLELSSLATSCPLARNFNTPLSRFAAVNLPETQPPAGQVFHVLFLVASPDGLPVIDADAELMNLLDACGDLLGRRWMALSVLCGVRGLKQETRQAAETRGVHVLDGACTAQHIADVLRSNPPIHGLHVLAHGSFFEGNFHLLLETDAGELDPVASPDLLEAWPVLDLRLVFLQSCESASEATNGGVPKQDAQSFMQDLLEAGVPAVVGMHDTIRMDDARNLCGAFYASLVRGASADQAINRARASIEDRGDGAWGTPILSTRLADAAIWSNSPLERAQESLEIRTREHWAVRQFRPLPIDFLVMDRKALDKQTRTDADEFLTLQMEQSAFRIDATEALEEILADKGEKPRPFTCIVGERGRAKKQSLEWLFLQSREAGRAAGKGTTNRVCVMLQLTDCALIAYDPETTLARAIATFYENLTGVVVSPQAILDQLALDDFIFLVNGDHNVGRSISEGLALLNDFSKTPGNERHCFVLTLDTNMLRVSELPEDSRCLLVQPMKQERVRKYLASAAPDSPERRLLQKLQDSALFDLAEVPWLLNAMLGQERRHVLGRSRTVIISRVVADGISRFTGTRASAVRLRDAMQRFAWVVQNRRDYFLKGPEAYDILQQLRGNRDYPLFGLLTDMINSCNILASIGDDGVGFNYPAFRTYCAAEYLASQPEDLRETLLQDITAQLGRLSRANIWRETLLFLAGLWSDTTRLLSMILSGSLLQQGEQVFIAARCLEEARLSFAVSPTCDEPIVQSIVGALLQMASPGAVSLNQKLRAIEHLGPLKEEQALGPLLSILFEETRLDFAGNPCLEHSSTRLAAIKALLYSLPAARAAVAANGRWQSIPQSDDLLSAWSDNNTAQLNVLLTTAHEPVASAAAMILALSRAEQAHEMLGNRFDDPEMTDDTLWAVTDALLEIGDSTLPKLVHDMLYREDRFPMLTHMIGKIGKAQSGSDEFAFLKTYLQSSDEVLSGRCLQALAELGQSSYLPLCHRWLLERSPICRYYVLQALKNIGTWETLRILEIRSWVTDQPTSLQAGSLDAMRAEVYESIYWRLVGGMSRETIAPTPLPKAASA